MDIQISSNFERYLFELFGRDDEKLTAAMDEFKASGKFKVEGELLAQARADFSAHRCDDEGTLNIIRNCHADTGEVIDPHTAVGLSGGLACADDIEGVIVNLACAHAAKFPDAVEKAIGERPPLPERLGDLFEKEEILTPLPNDLDTVENFVRQNAHITKKDAA